MKINKGFLQVGLVILVASIFAVGLILKNVGFPWSHAWDGPVPNNPQDEVGAGQVAEGCVVENKIPDKTKKGGFRYEAVGRLKKCGHRNQEQSNPTPVPTPSHTPSPTPTPIATPISTPESTPTPTSTPVPQGTPNWCGGTCGSNYNCQGGLYCYQGFCRNPDCPGEASCGCRVSTPTPPPVLGASTPPHLPKTGSDDLSVLAGLIGIGASGFLIFKKFQLI